MTSRNRIFIESNIEDHSVFIQRRGRVITIRAEREGVARSLERQIVDFFVQEPETPKVGFSAK